MERATHAEGLVRLRSASVVFGSRTALDRIDFDAIPGRVTVISGPNGAGKSTLLEVVAGTRPLTSGTRESVGAAAFVPQTAAVSESLPVTVRDVVTIGVWGGLGSWRRLTSGARSAIDASLARLGIADLADRPFGDVSGGQRQRALLAQALARGAGVLLLDEPTTGLDRESTGHILEVMRAEADRGVAVVCASHDPEVLRRADQLFPLGGGREVVAAGRR